MTSSKNLDNILPVYTINVKWRELPIYKRYLHFILQRGLEARDIMKLQLKIQQCKYKRHREVSSPVRINPHTETMDVLTDTKMPDR